MKIIAQQSRQEILDKIKSQQIKAAQAKKPTMSQINNRGLTAEQVGKLFGNTVPTEKIRKRINKHGGLNRREDRKKFTRAIRSATTTAPFLPPTSVLHPCPPWFTSNQHKDVDVSIIIPMYKSGDEIVEQIKSWDIAEDLSVEVIYVDDKCPEKSYQFALSSWENRKKDLKGRPVGKIIRNLTNGGFAISCNAGAVHANGKYVIFLNADTTVTTNWITPMIKLIESDASIGIVGNLQLKHNTDFIDSAGSEWDWESKAFIHIGRNIFQGKRISRAYKKSEAPSELLKVGEREMVTGCCFIMRRDLFISLEGFDPEFRIGYWEDADLNLRVRLMGYKIMFQPNSVIYHKVGHSNAWGHKYRNHNVQVFHKRWIETGRLDTMVNNKRQNPPPPILTPRANVTGRKVIGCVIACNEEEFLEASVNSVSSLVDKWYMVIGGNEYAYQAGMCDKNGLPSDSTLKIAHDLVSKYGGEVIEPPGRLWKDKVEMRNSYARKLTAGDWMFMLDGDEVYTENQLWRVTELMKQYECLIMNFWLFWNNMDTIGTGAWDKYPQERVVAWNSGYGYRGNNHLHVSDRTGALVRHRSKCWTGSDRLFYHYSWVRPTEKIRQKLTYYKFQSGNNNDSYVDDVFLKWRDNPELVQGKTHPMGGGGTTKFQGIHPIHVQKMIENGKLNF